MRAFLLVYFCIVAFGILARFALLAWKDYPREQTWTRGEDCLSLLVAIGFAAWAAWLLWS